MVENILKLKTIHALSFNMILEKLSSTKFSDKSKTILIVLVTLKKNKIEKHKFSEKHMSLGTNTWSQQGCRI